MNEQEPNESQTNIGFKDLPSYLIKQQDCKFRKGINKLVGNQENTPQKMMILKHGFGIVEDSKEDSSIGSETSIEDQSDEYRINVRSAGDEHLDVPNNQNFKDDGPRQNLRLRPNSNQV